MMQAGRTWAAFVVALAAVGARGIDAQAQDFVGHTEDQARAGQLAYERVCASCHMTNLQGAFEAPELAGPNFLNRWGGREVNELFVYLQASMPPAGRTPSDESFTNIIAYILERNGQEAGSAQLVATATTLVPTRDVVAGRAPGRGARHRRASGRPAGAAERAWSTPTAAPVPTVERRRRGLSAGNRRDAARPAARRLADVQTDLRRPGSQPARSDHDRERP